MKNSILWMCNGPLRKTLDAREGTVFTAMWQALVQSHKFHFAAIIQDRVKKPIISEYENISQLVVPYEPLQSNGLPSEQTLREIVLFVERINPDLVHVW